MLYTDTLTPGCLIEGGNYTIEDGNRRLIEIAQECGYVPQESAEVLDTDPEELEWEAQRADLFLNRHPAHEGFWFGWVDGDYICEALSDPEDY